MLQPDPVGRRPPFSPLILITLIILRSSEFIGWPRIARLGALVVAVVLGAGAALAASVASAPRPLNVLFIVADDLRTNLGCYGDPVAVTPHLDRLAARGRVFRRAYAQIAVCNPSRASVMTGRRPDTLRVWDLKVHFRSHLPDVVTLPQHFKNHGYRTEAVGKIYHDPPKFRDAPSWTVPAALDDTEGVRGKYAHPDNLKIYQPNGQRGSEKAAAVEAAEVPDNVYVDGRVADLAVERVRALAAQAQPFFLAVGFRRPHLPCSAPQRFWDLYDPEKLREIPHPGPPAGAPDVAIHNSVELRGYTDMPKVGSLSPEQATWVRHGYYAATSFCDAQIGRVLDALREARVDQSTVVVVWSDHGFHLGEHGLWGKTTNYELDTRVPLIISRPGQPHAGAATAALVELLDLYPTLVDLCGLPAAPGVEGRSLRPWLEEPARAGPSAAFSQFARPFPYREGADAMGYAVRTDTHRYIEWRRFGTREVVARELYALTGEALYETENLAELPGEAARVRELSALLPSGLASLRPAGRP
jgi:iduronate 2-sulfatase